MNKGTGIGILTIPMSKQYMYSVLTRVRKDAKKKKKLGFNNVFFLVFFILKLKEKSFHNNILFNVRNRIFADSRSRV